MIRGGFYNAIGMVHNSDLMPTSIPSEQSGVHELQDAQYWKSGIIWKGSVSIATKDPVTKEPILQAHEVLVMPVPDLSGTEIAGGGKLTFLMAASKPALKAAYTHFSSSLKPGPPKYLRVNLAMLLSLAEANTLPLDGRIASLAVRLGVEKKIDSVCFNAKPLTSVQNSDVYQLVRKQHDMVPLASRLSLGAQVGNLSFHADAYGNFAFYLPTAESRLADKEKDPFPIGEALLSFAKLGALQLRERCPLDRDYNWLCNDGNGLLKPDYRSNE
jgi:hypothetical protein